MPAPRRHGVLILAAIVALTGACASSSGRNTIAVNDAVDDSTGTVAPSADPPGLPLFIRGELVEFEGRSPVTRGKVPHDFALEPPGLTGSGVLAAVGAEGNPSELWLVRPDGTSARIANQGNGFAVDREGAHVAYAEPSEHATSVLHVLDVASGIAIWSSEPIDGTPHVIGLFDDSIVLNSGDGAAVLALLVSRADGHTVALGNGVVLAVDAASGLVVMLESDGPCWTLRRIRALTSTTEYESCNRPAAVAFSSSGLLAGVWLVDRHGGELEPQVFVREGSGEPVVAPAPNDVAQVAWESASALLVLSTASPTRPQISRCGVGGSGCEAVWEASDGGVNGSTWLVGGSG